MPPGPGYGDSIGAMTIAGGMMGALYPPRAHRRGDGRRRLAARYRHVGHGPGIRAVAAAGHAVASAARRRRCEPTRWCATTSTKDGQWLSLCCLQAGKYWPPLCERRSAGRSSATRRALHRPRSADGDIGPEASEILTGRSPSAPSRNGGRRLPISRPVDRRAGHAAGAALIRRRSPTATCKSWKPPRGSSFQLTAAPVQFDEQPAAARSGRRSSTSTATRSWPSSASTGTPSSISRFAASSPDAVPRSTSFT